MRSAAISGFFSNSMKPTVFMAFCFILIHHYGHVASEEDENDNDEKEKDKLSYRLVMFDPTSHLPDNVKEVREDVDDVDEDEEAAAEENADENTDENADENEDAQGGEEPEQEANQEDDDDEQSDDGNNANEQEEDDEQQQQQQQQTVAGDEDSNNRDNEAKINNNKESKSPNKFVSIDEQQSKSPSSDVSKMKKLPSTNQAAISGGYRDILDRWKQQEPYSFVIPADLKREIAKIQASKKIPSRIQKATSTLPPVTEKYTTSTNTSFEIMRAVNEQRDNYNRDRKKKKNADKKTKKKNKKKQKKNKSKKKKKSKSKKASTKEIVRQQVAAATSDDLATKEKFLSFANPATYLQQHDDNNGADSSKSIIPRDLNLHIRTKNPLPIFIRHYRTTAWPTNYPALYSATAGGSGSTSYAPKFNKPCKKNCFVGGSSKSKRNNKQSPKVQTDVLYRKKTSSNTIKCQHPEQPLSAPTYNYQQQPYYGGGGMSQMPQYRYPTMHKSPAYYHQSSPMHNHHQRQHQQHQQSYPYQSAAGPPASIHQYSPEQGDQDTERIADYHQQEVDSELNDHDDEEVYDDEEEKADETIRRENVLTVEKQEQHGARDSAVST